MIVYAIVALLVILRALFLMAKGQVWEYFLFVIFVFNLLPDVMSIKVGEAVPELKISQVFLGIMVIWIIRSKQIAEGGRFDKWTSLACIALMLVRLLASFYSYEFSLSFRVWIITVFSWFFMYYATSKLVTDQAHLERLIKVLIASALIVSLFNFVELFSGINLTQSETFERYERYGIPRVHGLLGDPVATAYYLLPIIPLCIYLYAKYRSNRWLVATIVIVAALVVDFARITFVSLGLMLVLYNLLISKRKLTFLVLTISIFATVGLTDNFIKQSLSDLMSTVQKDESAFDYTRTDALTGVAFQMVQNVPLFGLGPGSLTRDELMTGYFNSVGYMYVETSIRTELPIFVTMALECGIIASFLFLFLWIRAFRMCLLMSRRTSPGIPILAHYLFLSFAGYLLCLISNGVTNSLNLFFVLLGMTTVAVTIQKGSQTAIVKPI